MSRYEKKRWRGVSLLEMVISIAIFSLIMTTTVELFSRMVVTKAEFDRVRISHEKAQIALDSLAKSIRSGFVLTPPGSRNTVKLFDYSQGACIVYEFSEDTLRRGVDDSIDREACESASVGVDEVLTDGGIDGEFLVRNTDPSGSRGYVRISLVMSDADNPQESNRTRIQTTISMRNTE